VNDDAIEIQEVTDEPTPTTDAGMDRDAEVTRRTVRWYHVVGLAIAVLVCAAGAGFFVAQSSDRDDATNQRKAAQVALAAQRVAANHSRDRLSTDRKDAKTALDSVAQLTTALHELTDFSSQETDVMNQAHQLSVSNPDAVDQYNALVDRGNALIDEMNAQTQEIETLANQLRQQAQAQPAAFVR